MIIVPQISKDFIAGLIKESLNKFLKKTFSCLKINSCSDITSIKILFHYLFISGVKQRNIL